MVFFKPSFIIQSPEMPSSHAQVARLEQKATSSNSHISCFRSLFLDMQIYSPSIKLVDHPWLEIPHSLPVFGDQDKIKGKVILDPSCSQSGRFTISLEGIFDYSFVKDNVDDDYPYKPAVRKHRYVFLSSSVVIPISSIPDSRHTVREALSLRKRPSLSSLNSPANRSCEFSFKLPCGSRPCEEMPSTFSYKTPPGNSRLEDFEVAYRITVLWEETDGSKNRTVLEAPILYQADIDSHPIGGSAMEPESWLEMPLIPERAIPFSCAVTLPFPQSFSRSSSILYFVVFSTSSGSPGLIKEIAADATIAVSLIRKITMTPQRTPQPSNLPDTPPLSDESDSQASPFTPRSRFLRRVRTFPRSETPSREDIRVKALTELPQKAFSASRTLQTQVSIGFPKRPRANAASQNLPDGLFKGKLQLSKDMLPNIDWPGLSIKYYLDVSVLVGQDDVRACIPIKIY